MARIGIDLRALQGLHRYRGIGVYITQLMKAISETNHTDEFVLYMFEPYAKTVEQLQLSPKFKYKVSVVNVMVKNETVYKFLASYKTTVPFSTREIDVLLQPDIAFGVAAKGTPTVSVFYDSILEQHRDHYLDRNILTVVRQEGPKAALAYVMNRRTYNKGSKRYLLSSRILAISESSRHDLFNILEYPKEKVAVTPLATTDDYHSYDQGTISTTLQRLGVSRPYALYIGGADFRKNVSGAIDAFEAVLPDNSKLKLVLVGRDFEKEKLRINKDLGKKIARLGESVVCVGFGKEADLLKLYAGATVFLFPSLYEGFGIPVLQAMQSGCPVVAYANSSIPEIVQGSFELANTKEQYQDILKKVLNNKEYTTRAVKKAQAAAAKFSWKITAQKTLNNLKQVIDENTR